MATSSAEEIYAEIMAGMEAEREEIKTGVHTEADEVRDYGRSIAPVYSGPPHKDVVPGAYRDSIVVEEAPDHDGMPAVRVISRSRIARILEFGTVKMHEFGTFANMAAAFGGTLDDTGEGEVAVEVP
jgi:hypothetical protein